MSWLALNGPCARCGVWSELTVDHIDPLKKVSHRIWSLKESRRNRELAKCQVLCVECHKAKTSADKRAAMKHGTRGMYDKAHCRCPRCREANNAYARSYRRRVSIF